MGMRWKQPVSCAVKNTFDSYLSPTPFFTPQRRRGRDRRVHRQPHPCTPVELSNRCSYAGRCREAIYSDSEYYGSSSMGNVPYSLFSEVIS
jgi:hypothetical protein